MIPEIKLSEITACDPADVDLLQLPYEDGQLLDHLARILLAILIAEKPFQVLEIGTLAGTTALRMAHALPSAIIHTVDLPGGFVQNEHFTDPHLFNRRQVGREFVGRAEFLRIRQHLADTKFWDFHVGNPAPTFFFIDGSHSYEYVKNDSEKCHQLCNGQGIFLWHDVDDLHPGIYRFLEEWRILGRDVRKIADTNLGYYDGHNRATRS